MTGGGQALLAAAAPGVLGSDLAACDAWNGAVEAGKAVVCPTLFLIGAADRMTPPGASKGLRPAIAVGRVGTLPSTGPMVLVERPNKTPASIAPLPAGGARTGATIPVA